MRVFRSVLVASVILSLPATVIAQDTVAVSVGDRVRITSQDYGVQKGQGTLTKRMDGRLYVRRKGDSTDTWIVPINQLNAADVWRQHKGHRTMEGAAIGALVGTLAFALAIRSKDTCGDLCAKEQGISTVLSLPGAAIGAVVGGAIGRKLNAAGWDRVYRRP